MKRLLQVIFCLSALICGILSSCSKDTIWIFFTSDDLRWFPYDTVSVPEHFLDENGGVHDMRLLHRDFSHTNTGSSERPVYNNRGIAELMIDTFRLKIDLYKEDVSTWMHKDTLLYCDIYCSDLMMYNIVDSVPYYVDSIQAGAIFYYNVFVQESDTLWTTNRQCWRVIYSKERGLLRADFRNGHYYCIQ
jgi:hypothetical protein